MNLVDKMAAIHASLAAADIPHAFGGALALGWCTEMARATNDIDVNIFLPPDGVERGAGALPSEVTWSNADLELLRRDGQARFRWDENPVDLFFAVAEFHQQAATRIRWEPIGGRELPFLACNDLAVFKTFFARRKDWADLEEMHKASTLDVEFVLGVLTHYLGGDDERIEELRRLAREV